MRVFDRIYINRLCVSPKVGLVFSVLFLNSMLSHGCVLYRQDSNDPQPFTKAYNLETTEMSLQFLRENPTGFELTSKLGKDLQSRAQIGFSFETQPKCWESLRSSLTTNSDEYSLTAGDNGIMPNPRDVDDSIVDIDFPDKTRVRLIFYQSAVVGCNVEN